MLLTRANASRTLALLLLGMSACSSPSESEPLPWVAGSSPGGASSISGASGAVGVGLSNTSSGGSSAGGSQSSTTGGGSSGTGAGHAGTAGSSSNPFSGASAGGSSGGSAAGTPGTGGTLAGAGSGGNVGAGTAGSAAGSGGAAAGSGGGGNSVAADPSAGCGKANPPTGTRSSPLNVANHQYYVKLPQNYDPSTPYRLLFVFHPSGNPITWAEDNAGFPQTDAAKQAVIVYPKSAGTGWEQVDIAMFDPLYESLTNNFCIDKKRVFATGESSGGDYSSVLGCEKATKVRAVGPTAAKPMAGVGLNPGNRTCSGQSAAYVIHGKNDNVVGAQAGIQTRDFHLAKNHCGTMTTPVQGFTDRLSNCVEYSGCDEGYPVFWCQHEDPNYSNTNHGWPAFAAKFLWQKFTEY